ncbi:hypothetical protein JCM10207_000411 [Rhodosporidiobolus poonsookiae]
MAATEPSRLSTSALFDRLHDLRLRQERRPEEVLHLAETLVQRGAFSNDNDKVWDAMEQAATAAIECNQLSLATVLVSRLATRFADKAPRVAALQGMLLEGRGELTLAREFYEDRMRENETDVTARKRLIALHLSSPLELLPSSPSALPASHQPYFAASLTQQKGVQILVHYLDTYYADAAAWQTLSSAYARLGLYPQALSAQSHALLLLPNSPWVALKMAELAYTAGEVEQAWKGFLRVVEMSDTEEGRGLQGAGRRAAMGAKLCLPRLRSPSKPSSPLDPLLTPTHLDELDLLLTRLLLDSYSEKQAPGAVGAGLMRKWVGGAAEGER